MDQSLLESMRVIALPTKTNFRGVNLREVALFQGEYGWGEFSPLHSEFHSPLRCSSDLVSKAVLELSSRLSPLT